jgi:hypothetical protein
MHVMVRAGAQEHRRVVTPGVTSPSSWIVAPKPGEVHVWKKNHGYH